MVILIYLAYIHQEAFAIPEIMNMPVVDEEMKAAMLERFKTWRWVGFAAVPLLILIRVSLVGACLSTGAMLNEKFSKLTYSGAYGIAMKSDVISVLHTIVSSVIIITLFRDDVIKGQTVFSLLYFIDMNAVDKWLTIPCASINLFEVIYWFFMSKLVSVATGNKFWKSFEFVMCTYGVGYLIYIVLMMFITLYLSA
uniref:Yip1 domain-containing protein n=1 Tax=termite gut metagenome TaxID=433724 RepID=S0DE83_9ZZZZ